MSKNSVKKIIIIDFGSQVTQLIARQIRELGVYCELVNYKIFNRNNFLNSSVKGIVLSGGPKSTLHKSAPSINRKLINSNIPVLGICYGHQLISNLFGGKTKYSKKKEFGSATLFEKKKSKLTEGFYKNTICSFKYINFFLIDFSWYPYCQARPRKRMSIK